MYRGLGPTDGCLGRLGYRACLLRGGFLGSCLFGGHDGFGCTLSKYINLLHTQKQTQIKYLRPHSICLSKRRTVDQARELDQTIHHAFQASGSTTSQARYTARDSRNVCGRSAEHKLLNYS